MFLRKFCNTHFNGKRIFYEIGQNTTNKSFCSTSTNSEKLDKLYRNLGIEVRGNDPAVLKSYGIFASTAANHLGVVNTRNFAPKRPDHDRMTLLKSKHVHKKHRVQYEIRTYYRFLEFQKLTSSTADTFLEYIQRNLPEGVFMKVTKTEIRKLPEAVSAPIK